MKKKIVDFFKKIFIKAKEHKIVSFVVLIFVCGLFYFLFSGDSSSYVSYQYTTVKRGSISSIVSGTGQVISNSQVDLKPKVNANVTGVYVRAGDRVRNGQVLFRLDATEAYKQVRDAKTSLESAKLALEKLRNPKAIDIMSINNSIKQEEDSKKTEDQKVDTAYRTLLNANLEAVPEISYTTETAPTLNGSYLKDTEGQIKISVSQGGSSGYSFNFSGIANGNGQISTSVAQPIGDTGLYIKWNSSVPQTNWVINIPNRQSSSYSSNYNSWKNSITNRDIANAASDRNIESLKQKLSDLTPGDDNLDVKSAILTVQQRENSLLDAQVTLSNYVITAPFDGVMANVSVDVGSSAVMASANTSSALGTIVTDKKLAQVILNEADIVKVKLGQKAKMTFDAIDGLEVEGVVVEINTLGTVTSGVVTYKTKVAFNTDDVRILPNMSVTVDILTDSKDNILYVPSSSVKKDSNGYYVEKDSSMKVDMSSSTRRFSNGSSTNGYRFATGTNSTSSLLRNGSRRSSTTGMANVAGVNVSVVRVPVTTGVQNDTQIEIISGLAEGEQIILKKATLNSTSKANSSAPSVTSLFRPQGGTRAPGGGNFRP